MDVFNRLLPRSASGNVQFKKLKHKSNSVNILTNDEATGDQHEDDSLCDGISNGSRKNRPNFAEALQKVREKLNFRPSSNNSNCASAFSSSSPMHRSNTTPTPFSMKTPNNKNCGRNKEERTADAPQQRRQQEGAVLTKLRKQAKIMDIMGRKSHGNVGKNRKSDGQHLLLSEDGYCSGLE